MSIIPFNKPPLPESWTPGDHDVVVGKGKKFYLHSGNVMLRDLVSSLLAEYSKANTKAGKSDVISVVVEHVNAKGCFVKRDLMTGNWCYAEDRLCREKCSQTFRDLLHETYKSSSIAKKNKRRREQAQHNAFYQSSPSPMITQDHKRMRLMDPFPVRVNPSPIASELFEMEMDMFLPTPIKTTSFETPPPKEDNLVSALSRFLALPIGEDDGTNPFEPTPLPLGPSSSLNPSTFFDDEVFSTSMLSDLCGNDDEMEVFPRFSWDNTFDNHVEDLRTVSPSVSAAFAA